MSLPFDISEKLKSVQVRHYVEWLGRDSHCGYGFAFGYDEKSYRLIDELFQMLQDVETDDEDGAKELWLCARRGTIDDFAKQYGTYEENLEDGTVKNQKEYEDYWKSEFPDEVEWYRFVAVEHTDIKYRCVFLSNKQVLEMDKRLESGYTHDISEFTEWLVDAVKLTMISLDAKRADAFLQTYDAYSATVGEDICSTGERVTLDNGEVKRRFLP